MLEFTDKVVGTAVIKKPLTEKDIENIIVTAFEGGSNYWMGLDNSTDNWKNKPKGVPLSQWATKLLLEESYVKLYDIEQSEDDSNWVITLEKIIKGYEMNCIERPHDCDLEQGDAGTADCILQYALFGKVVFG